MALKKVLMENEKEGVCDLHVLFLCAWLIANENAVMFHAFSTLVYKVLNEQ